VGDLHNASVLIKGVGQKHESLTAQDAGGSHGVRRIGEQNGMRSVSNRASHSMAAEIDDADVMFAAGCLDGRNVFVSPAQNSTCRKPAAATRGILSSVRRLGYKGSRQMEGVMSFHCV
jgi:hypothetical protein